MPLSLLLFKLILGSEIILEYIELVGKFSTVSWLCKLTGFWHLGQANDFSFESAGNRPLRHERQKEWRQGRTLTSTKAFLQRPQPDIACNGTKAGDLITPIYHSGG